MDVDIKLFSLVQSVLEGQMHHSILLSSFFTGFFVAFELAAPEPRTGNAPRLRLFFHIAHANLVLEVQFDVIYLVLPLIPVELKRFMHLVVEHGGAVHL